MLGITINETLLTDTLLDLEDNNNNKLCDPSVAENTCYLLDEGGFIIAENLQEDGYSHVRIVCL